LDRKEDAGRGKSRIDGVLHGRRGGFLLEASGEISPDHYVHGRWEIIPARGTMHKTPAITITYAIGVIPDFFATP
jgi:hypothetical protein